MGKEVENKYLLRENGANFWTANLLKVCDSFDQLIERVRAEGDLYHQGYLPFQTNLEIMTRLGMMTSAGLNINFVPIEGRLRFISNNRGRREFVFTVKGDGSVERDEENQPISEPLYDLFWPSTLGKRVQKIRLGLPYEGHTAEIDLYTDRPDLVVSEVEVPTREIATGLRPLGKDITKDKAYKNKNLAR